MEINDYKNARKVLKKGLWASAVYLEALERQIPQKVEQLRSRIYDSDNETCGFIVTTYCGNCNEQLKGHIVFYKYDYCPKCGQRLDWGDNHDTEA